MSAPRRISAPWKRLAAACCCLLLGGCAAAFNLAAPPAPKIYSLTPKSTFEVGLPEVTSSVTIETPTATAGLNTARIALRPTPTTLDYYAGATWIDVVPVMVQNLLIESLDNTGRIDVLGRAVVGVRADLALLVHVREFQAEYVGGGRPKIRVRLQARLVRLPRRTSIRTTSEDVVVTAEDSSLDAIVRAFDVAFGRAAKRIGAWTIKQAAAAADTTDP
jgi:cholesterol transport system auxiliary component